MRRIPLSRRSHVIGFQPLARGIIEHESALERDFVTLTSFLDAQVSITSQPITLFFRRNGRALRYTPDFLVRPLDSPADLVEVKYADDLAAQAERLQPAFEAAQSWASRNDGTFRIVTDAEIRGSVLENAKRLLPLRRAPIDRKAAVRVLSTVAAMSASSFGTLTGAVSQQRSLTLATVWRLIARGELVVDLAHPISIDTEVRLP